MAVKPAAAVTAPAVPAAATAAVVAKGLSSDLA